MEQSHKIAGEINRFLISWPLEKLIADLPGASRALDSQMDKIDILPQNPVVTFSSNSDVNKAWLDEILDCMGTLRDGTRPFPGPQFRQRLETVASKLLVEPPSSSASSSSSKSAPLKSQAPSAARQGG
jgi:hypothetical protein